MSFNKMVNDFITTINNSKQHRQLSEKPQQNPSNYGAASNYKTNKKCSKTKKSNTKSLYQGAETNELPQTSTKRGIKLIDYPKTTAKNVIHTKVKSGSWKRSEKSIAPLNAFNANKKHKNLRQKSPNWLKFSNSKIKKQDLNPSLNRSEATSACRPGTLYSDVLFGAGCTNLVKIKSITPRNYNNTSANASRKLSKNLLKYKVNENIETSDDSEIDGKKNVYPALAKFETKIDSPSMTVDGNNNFENLTCSVEKIANNEMSSTSKTSPAKNKVNGESDIVTLSGLKGLSLAENDVDHANYMEQQPNVKTEAELASDSRDKNFMFSSISNIPKWNFMSIETGFSDDFPKFLCQFEDENYLKAEKIALLGLKLALGNYSSQN